MVTLAQDGQMGKQLEALEHHADRSPQGGDVGNTGRQPEAADLDLPESMVSSPVDGP